MKNITRWSPDTCECVIEYEWDTEESEDTRIHSPKKIVKACSVHAGNNVHLLHAKVSVENTGKNQAFAKLLQAVPAEHKQEIVNPKTQEVSYSFIVEPKWNFTDERKLVIEHPALSDKKIVSKLRNDVEKSHPGLLDI